MTDVNDREIGLAGAATDLDEAEIDEDGDTGGATKPEGTVTMEVVRQKKKG